MKVLWLALALLFITVSAEATTYYVDKAGSNNNNCATAATASSNRTMAKQTIGGGIACATSAGDIVTVGDGTYTEGQVSFAANGSPGSPITLRAEHKWLAVLNSTSPAQCQANIVTNFAYSLVDGLSLTIASGTTYCTPNSTSGTGVRAFESGAGGLVVRNIKTDDPVDAQGRKYRSHGIKSNQENTILEDNELAAGLETLIAHNAIIRRNHITGGGNWDNGIVTKGGSYNVKVYDNIVDAPNMVGAGIVLGGANASDSPPQECFNCVAWNNVVRVSPNGVSLNFQGCKDCAFVNNVSVRGAFGMDTAPSSSNINNRWLNNIIDCQGSNATQNLQGTFTIDYNDFYNCSNTPSQAHPIVGNPQFVNPQTGDWHLSPSSPAIGSGVPVLFSASTGAAIDISKDIDGVTRIAPWSLGIYRAAAGTTDITPPRAPGGLIVN